MAPIERWASCEEVADATALCGRAIRSKAKREGWKWRKSSTPGPNGKSPREYLVSSLPAEVQVKLAAQGSTSMIAQRTLPFAGQNPGEDAVRSRVVIPENLEPQARARYDAIEPMLKFREHRQSIVLAGGRRVSNLDELADWIGAQQVPPVDARTIWRWLRRFGEGGYQLLPHSVRKDRGAPRGALKIPIVAAFLHTKYLAEGLSVKLSHEALCRDWPQLSKTGNPPSYSTVGRYLNKLPEGVKTLARVGPQAAMRNHTPHIIRGPVPVMDWWVLDHRTLDVLTRNVLFDHLEPNAAYRLSLTAIFDWGSRKRVGWCFAPTPSSRTIYSALRMAVAQYGFPRNFYWDNGKDFRKVAGEIEGAPLEALAVEQFLAKYSVGITHTLPRHPGSKPIESWFAADSLRFCPRWKPAYVGRDPKKRPEACTRAEADHKLFLAGKLSESPLPLDAAVIRAMVQFFEEENLRPREALNQRTPDQAFDEAYPLASRQLPGARMLDILFSERKELTVQAGGCVQTHRVRYTPTDESVGPMVMREKRKILLLRDPYDIAEATAVDPETGEFIGELVWQEFIAQCPNGRATADQIAAGMRRQRGVHRAFREYNAFFETITSAQGWKTEAQLLLERAVRTGTDDAAALAAAPGAQRALPAARHKKPISPFISDAMPDVIAAFKEDE